jgi:hypothetical protein
MSRVASLLFVIAVAACGGKSASRTVENTTPVGPAGGDGAAAAKLPWEAAFTEGKTFALVEAESAGGPDETDPITIKITKVEDHGNERIYTLAWSDAGNGLEKIIVRGDKVTFNDVALEGMQEPFETPVGMCYGEDLSDPDGCNYVCDGHLCLDAEGIQLIDGLYAPNYTEWVAK